MDNSRSDKVLSLFIRKDAHSQAVIFPACLTLAPCSQATHTANDANGNRVSPKSIFTTLRVQS
jgi:hypothetical protein